MIGINKSVLIYGIGKVQKDFEYMFPQLEVKAYIADDDVPLAIWQGKNIIPFSQVSFPLQSDKQIIICDFDFEVKRKNLEMQGAVYKKDFIIADDLFPLLNFPLLEKSGNRRIAIWGTGVQGKHFYKKEAYADCIAFWIDSDRSKEGHILYGKKILHIDDLLSDEIRDLYIVIAIDDENAYFEIRNILIENGLTESNDFIWKRLMDIKASEMLKETIYDKSQYDLVCDTMFNTYEIEATGAVCCCCTTFVLERLGNLIYQSFNEIWYSNIHKVLCLSAANKTYTFCKKDMCPILMVKKSLEYVNNYKDISYRQFGDPPKVMLLSIDSTCNLYCKSCRNCIQVIQGNSAKKAEIMAGKLLSDDNLKNAEFLVMAGNGEVFLSKIYEKIWSNEKTKHIKRFRLLSNGTLFNEQRWNTFMTGRTSEVAVTFSIDAATADTYQVLRRGGNFNILLNNLKFASKLRKEGKLAYFQISFVVQRKNYKEMPMFVKMGKELGVDKVFFTRILDWGTYSREEFKNITMTDSEGRPNTELLEILQMPIMQERIVDLGTIVYKKKEKEYGYIYNYYLWEIDRYLEMEE